MKPGFEDVQRIVLVGGNWTLARYLMIDFRQHSPCHFLKKLLAHGVTAARKGGKPAWQVSLGFTRRGLQHAEVPAHVMGCFALKAPAFWTGAALRAAGNIGLSGPDGPGHWEEGFGFTTLDAVLSVHADEEQVLAEQLGRIKADLKADDLNFLELPDARALPPPPGVQLTPEERKQSRWVHFGYRDGLARIGIEGWNSPETLAQCRPFSKHQAGEFVLGHRPDNGADRWVAGPGLFVWPEPVRSFFRNGSFGVLQQIRQETETFEAYVKAVARQTRLHANDSEGEAESAIRAKLCGRTPEGRPLAAPDDATPEADFDYDQDDAGYRCPFGSHVRRMNPRLSRRENGNEAAAKSLPSEFGLAHFARERPLLRRGMPYGRATWDGGEAGEMRGLIGHFFCACIEDQFEHVLREWADRVPMGSPDQGGARDPFFGHHQPGDGAFEIPEGPKQSQQLPEFRTPFAQTLGVAYLFYPSLDTLKGIAESRLWGLVDKDGNT